MKFLVIVFLMKNLNEFCCNGVTKQNISRGAIDIYGKVTSELN